MHNNTTILKIIMSKLDLERFKKFIENHFNILRIGLKRNRKISILLGEAFAQYEYEISFCNFSKIDNLPLISFIDNIDKSEINEVIENGELLDFKFINPEKVKLIKINYAQDYDYD